MNEYIPWASWFRYGIVELGLSPKDFWQLSYCEWIWLCAHQDEPVMTKQEVLSLRALYPDKVIGHE